MTDMFSSDIAQHAIRLLRWLCGRSVNGPLLRHTQMMDGRTSLKILTVCVGAGLVPTMVHADINRLMTNVQAQPVEAQVTAPAPRNGLPDDTPFPQEEHAPVLAEPAAPPRLTGADEAALLNRRYGLTVDSCGVNKPAWHCSGVLMHNITDGTKQFWKLNSIEQALQSVAYTYLRKDVSGAGTGTGPGMGMVLADLPTAVAAGKSYTIRCVYPEAAPPDAAVPDHGCNRTGSAIPPNPDGHDDSSCAAVGVKSASQWKDKYLTTAPRVQCSFNAQLPDPFNQSLQAYLMALPTASGTNVQMHMAAWDEAHPETIAIEALYYHVGDEMPLLPEAQARQLAYYQATGIWLPLLRYQPGADTPFGYDETDQIYYGDTVVARINARYFDTTDCPNNMAAYMCNGVVVRVTGYKPTFHSWNPSPTAIAHNGVSVSYLRSDLRTNIAWGEGVGLVHREFSAPAAHPLEMRCMYPTDGYTNNRPDKCGAYNGRPTSAPCADLGITTLDAWRANYKITGFQYQCSLGVDKAAFELSMQARTTFNPMARAEEWNEAILAIWDQNIPSQLPLEAIFHTAGQLADAQYIQKDYFQQTRRFLPIVQVNTKSELPFVYVLGDQNDSG